MSKDSAQNSRLLSKVVKFVTNPTTNWSDLDRPPSENPSQDRGIDEASRQALKQIIERKRRNDFVRNREFDMLRKVRNSQLKEETSLEQQQAPGASMVTAPRNHDTPSPQLISLPTGSGSIDARADTLKKIDQIEQQMARSWFKRKTSGDHHDMSMAVDLPPNYMATQPAPEEAVNGALPPVVEPPPLPPLPVVELPPEPPVDAPAAQPVLGQGGDIGFAATEMLAHAPALSQPVAEPLPELEQALTAETLDHELEEAAIRFANGDDQGAEASLLELVGNDGERNGHVETWLALFDLYRASGQQAKFDEAAIDFASCFGRSAPQWSVNAKASSFEQLEAPAEAAAPLPGQIAHMQMHWVCPSTLGVQSVAALNAVVTRNASPWHVDWRGLKTIEDAALPPLLEMLRRWGSAKGEYCLRGAGHLLGVLAEHSPTDNREIDPQWWNARMALLRLMGEMDEFELVALNYCVTYEVSPPAWEDPVAKFVPIDETAGADAPPPLKEEPPPPHSMFQPSDFASSRIFEAQEGIVKGDLIGIVTDDVDKALRPLNAAIDHAAAHAQSIEINCRLLLRMDFSAAGGLLNWVTMQQALKRQVTLRQVNRLVGAFFGVIGIHEAARVILRKD